MLDVLTPESSAAVAALDLGDTVTPAPTRADKRAAIDRELAADPSRSNNEIARVCGVDHKTVGARRQELGISNSQLGNSQPAKIVVSLAPKENDEDRFDWLTSEAIVLKEQRATAVYLNDYGDV